MKKKHIAPQRAGMYLDNECQSKLLAADSELNHQSGDRSEGQVATTSQSYSGFESFNMASLFEGGDLSKKSKHEKESTKESLLPKEDKPASLQEKKDHFMEAISKTTQQVDLKEIPFNEDELRILKLARSMWLHLENSDSDQIQLSRSEVISKLNDLGMFQNEETRSAVDELLTRARGPKQHSKNPLVNLSHNVSQADWIVKSDETFQQWKFSEDQTFSAEEIIDVGKYPHTKKVQRGGKWSLEHTEGSKYTIRMTWDKDEGHAVLNLTDSLQEFSIIESSWEHLEKVSLINGYYTVLTLDSHPGKALAGTGREEVHHGGTVCWFTMADAAEKGTEVVVSNMSDSIMIRLATKIQNGFDVAYAKTHDGNTIHTFSHWPDNHAQKYYVDSVGHLCMYKATDMIWAFDPKGGGEQLKIQNRDPSRRKQEHMHYEPLRFNALKKMTPDKSEIIKLTLQSHPGKAIVLEGQGHDIKFRIGNREDAFRVFINKEGNIISEDIPIFCIEGRNFKSGHPITLEPKEPSKQTQKFILNEDGTISHSQDPSYVLGLSEDEFSITFVLKEDANESALTKNILNSKAFVFDGLQDFFEPLPEIGFEELCNALIEMEDQNLCKIDDLVDEMLFTKYPSCCKGKCVKSKSKQTGCCNKLISAITCNGCFSLVRYLRQSACKDQSLHLFGIKQTGTVTAFKNQLSANLRMYEIYLDTVLYYSIWHIAVAKKDDSSSNNKYFWILSIYMFAQITPFYLPYSSQLKQIWTERQSQSFHPTCWKSFILGFTLTFLGPFKFLAFEIWEAITLSLYFILTLVLGLVGIKVGRSLERLISSLTMILFGFSDQQVRNFKRQKFVSNTYFKQFPMFIVKAILLLKSQGYSEMKGLEENTGLDTAKFFTVSFLSMFVNAYLQISQLKGEAKLLDMSFLEYSFFCIVAMTGFFPYQHQFNEQKPLPKEKNLRDLRNPKSFKRSDMLADYSFYHIEIDDLMLDELTTRLRVSNLKHGQDLGLDQSEMELFISGCLMQCSANYVLPFCNAYPKHVAQLDFDNFNWNLYEQNQFKLSDPPSLTRRDYLEIPLNDDQKQPGRMSPIILTKNDLNTFIDNELHKYALRLPGYERNYCEVKALSDDIKALNLDKQIRMLTSLNGTPLVIGCIQNEPMNCPDFSQPWPLKALMDLIIEESDEDILYVKDEFKEDLLVHSFQNNRIKSFGRFLRVFSSKDQHLIVSSQLLMENIMQAIQSLDSFGGGGHSQSVVKIHEIIRLIHDKFKQRDVEPLWLFLTSLKASGDAEYIPPIAALLEYLVKTKVSTSSSDEDKELKGVLKELFECYSFEQEYFELPSMEMQLSQGNTSLLQPIRKTEEILCAKPYEQLSDRMKKAIMISQPKIAESIAKMINEKPNSSYSLYDLRMVWWRGGPDCPIMNKFYPCPVAQQLLAENKEFRGKSAVMEMIAEDDCLRAKKFIKEEIYAKKRYYQEYCDKRGQEAKEEVKDEIEKFYRMNLIFAVIRKKLNKMMIRKKEEDFSRVNRRTADPNNVIDEELAKQEKEERDKMLKDRAQLRNSKIFDWVINFVLETISLFDMISDLAVLVILVREQFIFIAVISLFVIYSAIIVCYAPLINFFIARRAVGSKLGMDQKFGLREFFFTLINLTPFIALQLTLIDIIYTVNQLFIEPIVLILNILMCNCKRNNGDSWIDTEQYLDGLFMYFNMDTMDVKGYRRLRTISQLIFESVPQVFIQVFFLWYVKNCTDMKADDDSVQQIFISIELAALHSFIELIYLCIENRIVKAVFSDYALACMNGRLNWLPFTEKINKKLPENHDKKDWYFFDFDLHHKFCFGTLHLDFQFTKETIESLSEKISAIPTTLKEISTDEQENADNGRFTVRITDRSAHKITLQTMIPLLNIAFKRAHIDIKGWEISFEKLVRCGYKKDHDYPQNIDVPELMSIINIQRYDVLKRLLKCGAYTFQTNSQGLTMIPALNQQKKFDVIQYVVKCLPYYHVKHLMRLMRLANEQRINFDSSSKDIDVTNMFFQFEVQQIEVGQDNKVSNLLAVALQMSPDPKQTSELRHWYETFYGPYGVQIASQLNPLMRIGRADGKAFSRTLLNTMDKSYPKKVTISIDGSQPEQFDMSTISTFSSLRVEVMKAIKERKPIGDSAQQDGQADQDEPQDLQLDLNSRSFAGLKTQELRFFDQMHKSLRTSADDICEIEGDRNNFDRIVIKCSDFFGGENNTNHKTYEWPSDDYLMSLDKDQLANLKITQIKWVKGTQFGPAVDFVNSWVFVNSLGDESEPFSEKKEPLDVRDFSQTEIGSVRAKTNYHHVAQYKFFDKDKKQIGEKLFSKYDENKDAQYEVVIPKDEVVVGFKVMLSDWVDCKISKMAFKTIKFLTNEQYETLQKTPAELKPNFKWLPYEMVRLGVDKMSYVNMDVLTNNNLANFKARDIQSVTDLHRFDLLTEKLCYTNLKFMYVAATLKQRKALYNIESKDKANHGIESQFMGNLLGVKIGDEDQVKETNSGFHPFEIKVPNDLYHAYSVQAKIVGKLPKNANLRFRCISYFKEFTWNEKSMQDWTFDLEEGVDDQTLFIEFSDQMPSYEVGISAHAQNNIDLKKWGLLTEIRPSMLLYYGVMELNSLIQQPQIEVKLTYIKKNYESFTKE